MRNPSNVESVPIGSTASPDPSVHALNQYGAFNLEDKQDSRFNVLSKANRSRRKNGRVLFISLCALILVIAAVVLAVYFGAIRNRKVNSRPDSSQSAPSGSPSSSGHPPGNSGIIYGGDGTVVTTENGSTFTYSNKFGGYFVVDPDDPFNNNARAQSWSPPLNQSWQWGTDVVRG
jgi:glucan 1,3-beta-glucosidase